MHRRTFFHLFFLGLIILFTTISAWAGPVFKGEPQRTAVVAALPPELDGGRLDIAVSADAERNPQAVLCTYDQYLVAFTKNGGLYGQFLGSDGGLLGGVFEIVTASGLTSPAVACDWTHGRFLVAWQGDSPTGGHGQEIFTLTFKAQYVSGEDPVPSDIIVWYTNRESNNTDPAIACNHFDNECLVVYEDDETNNGDIVGQRYQMGINGIVDRLGDHFSIGAFAPREQNPTVVWGADDEHFLVAWQYEQDTPQPHERIIYALVHDTDQGSGDEISKGGTYLIGLGSYDQHQLQPSAAYNAGSPGYLIVFQHDYANDGSDFDVRGRRVGMAGDPVGEPLTIAATFEQETAPTVAYSGGLTGFADGKGADQYMVAYFYEGTLYAQAITGSEEPGGSQLVPGGTLFIADPPATFGSFLSAPLITGSVNNGKYLLVWEKLLGGFNPAYDIHGQLIKPAGTSYCFLPLLTDG